MSLQAVADNTPVSRPGPRGLLQKGFLLPFPDCWGPSDHRAGGFCDACSPGLASFSQWVALDPRGSPENPWRLLGLAWAHPGPSPSDPCLTLPLQLVRYAGTPAGCVSSSPVS